MDCSASSSSALAQIAEALRREPNAVPVLAPHLTLAQAVEYSGLPAAFLIAQARAGKVRAVNVGTGAREFWRFEREALAR